MLPYIKGNQAFRPLHDVNIIRVARWGHNFWRTKTPEEFSVTVLFQQYVLSLWRYAYCWSCHIPFSLVKMPWDECPNNHSYYSRGCNGFLKWKVFSPNCYHINDCSFLLFHVLHKYNKNEIPVAMYTMQINPTSICNSVIL